ncbi:MAG: CHAD domain-containing protein [Ignavibacteria bacterium]|nr:CHAD domain-containing protein [Ignavibacteria bacterium]
MLSISKIEGFNVNKQTGFLLPKIFHLFYDDLREKITLLQQKYTPTRLHNSRVAGRRMQAILIGFRNVINRKKCKYGYDNTLDSIKRIIKILGSSREYEVTYDITSKYVKLSKTDRDESLILFLSFLRSNKNQVLKDLYKDKYFLKYQNNLRVINSYIKEYLLNNVPIDRLLTPYKNIYSEIIAKYFYVFLNKVKKFNLLDSQSVDTISSEKLHKFRIETKTFRYLLDMSSGLFTDEFDKLRINIKNIVEKLGEYHDLDVVISYTQKFLVNRISNSNLSPKPLLDYLKHLYNQKGNTFLEISTILNLIDENYMYLMKNCEIFK